MLGFGRKIHIETERLTMRLPVQDDWQAWSDLRAASVDFLAPWEPLWSERHLSRRAFSARVQWARQAEVQGNALSLVLMRRDGGDLVGALTLDNIRRGPAQAATIGYWIGAPHSRQGYMHEAVLAVVYHAFNRLDLSRIEAACLPENVASRGLLEKCGFKYEGVAQAYLQINGRWRNHVLYACLRADRRGRTGAGTGT